MKVIKNRRREVKNSLVRK